MQNVQYTTYLVKDDHEGIVSRETWEAVKKRLDSNEQEIQQGIYKTKTQTHYLYGLVFCAECGSPMVRRTYPGYKKEKYKAWNCKGKQHGNGCTNSTIRESELLEQLENAMEERGIVTDGDIESAIVQNIRRVDVGPEEIRITFKDEADKAG